jgi:hypothetical protein
MPSPNVSTQVESVAPEDFLIGSPELYGNIGFRLVSDKTEVWGTRASARHARLVPAVDSAIRSKLFKMHDFRLHDPGHSMLTHEQRAQ